MTISSIMSALIANTRRGVLCTACALLWLPGVALPQPDAPFEVAEVGIADLQSTLASGRTTSVELVQQYLARIERYDQRGPELNSIIRLNPDALERAAALDSERRSGRVRSALHGIPIVVKDNYNTTTMPTTGGSVALANFVPSQNATQIDLLLDAGAIILAKTNLHEYAYGITTVSSLLGQTRNPYDLRRVPGGSSGGTAAAVAASFAAIGLGSDTCGSIRIPSAFNNLVGLRPSKGLSSIYGVMPLSTTQDVAGPLARSTEDLAILLDVVSGYDARDPATAFMADRDAPGFRDGLESVSLQGLRLGRLDSYLDGADGRVGAAIDSALDWFVSQGAELVPVDTSELTELIGSSGVIGHEFRADLDQYLALFVSDQVGSLDDIVDLGLYHQAVAGALQRSQQSVSNPDAYRSALAAREQLHTALEELLADQNLDALVCPPIAELPVMIGESQPGNNCSLSANSGLPAIALPLGFTDSGLPVAMELLGGFMDDARLLSIAHAWEQGNAPRRAPSTVPPLSSGMPPEPLSVSLEFVGEGVHLDGVLQIDVLRNTADWQLEVVDDNSTEVFAVTLVIDSEQHFQLSDPVAVNLLGPQQSSSSGSYYMSPQFREAIMDQRVYIKVFANGFDPAGVARLLSL